MKIEHCAVNVQDPLAMATWYVKHLGLKIVKHLPEPNQTHFLSDGVSSMIEIYKNGAAPIPDYISMDPLVLHLAFASDAPQDDAQKLIEAGATPCSEIKLPDGTELIMLRDPWGLSIQLCKRPAPFV